MLNFNPNAEFYLSSGGLLLGTVGSIYLIFEYLQHGKRDKFLILWSLALFMIYWFRLPIILINSGSSFIFSYFNIFLAVAFPMGLAGFLLFLWGIQSIHPSLSKKGFFKFAAVWILAAIGFFILIFPGHQIKNYLPVWTTNLLIFMPVRALIIFSLLKWLIEKWQALTGVGKSGIFMMATGMILGFVQHIIAIPRIISFPPELWFIAISNFPPTFILEITGTLLLLLGALLSHKDALGKTF